MNLYITALKKYAVFDGRARRKEYWMFTLFYIIFFIVAMVLDVLLGTDSGDLGFISISGLYMLALLLPSWAVTVRRLHDVGKSGWWIFIKLVPIIGEILLFILLVTDSQPGENQYGPNPKAVSAG